MCAALLAHFLASIISAQASESPRIGQSLLRVYSNDQIGFDQANWNIAQDTDGTLFFGRDGVTVFDGERWRSLPMNHAYAVRGLAFGADGKLWAAGHGEIGWFERESGDFVYHSLVAHLPEEYRELREMWNAFPDEHGAVFIEEQRVLQWDGTSFRVWPMLSDQRIRAFRAAGKIYIHGGTSGLHVLTPSGPRLVAPANVFQGERVWWLKSIGDGYRVLTRNGFGTLRNGQFVLDQTETTNAIKRALPGIATEAPDGRLLICTVHGGVIIASADGQRHISIDTSDGLPGSSVTGAIIDRDAQLWITGYSFVARWSLAPGTTILDGRNQLPPQPIHALAMQKETLFAANIDSVLQLKPDTLFFKADPNAAVSTLLPTANGLLQAGFSGLQQFSAGTLTTLTSQRGQVLTVTPSRLHPGSVLISQNLSLIHLNADFSDERVVCPLSGPVNLIAEDSRGFVWMGRPQGVEVVDTAAKKPKPQRPEAAWKLPPINSSTHVAGDVRGGIYVFANEGAWHKPPGATSFVPIAGFSNQSPVAVTPAHSDEVWAAVKRPGHAPAVGQVVHTENGPRWEVVDIDGLAGLGTPVSLLLQKTGNGKRVLWIGGVGAILRTELPLTAQLTPPRLPLLRVQSFVGEAAAPQAITTDLPYSTRSIRFEFAAPEFNRRELLRIESFIEGIDRDWVPAGRDSMRELTGLRDGTFKLKARVVANTGATSPTTEFTFTVLPPWWRTAPVLLGLTLAMFPLGYGLMRLRVRALDRRNAELEEKVRQRTEELEAANAAKTEFVANMSHDIRNPLNGIVGLALALEQSKLDQRQREVVSTLRECTGYLSTLVDDVLDFTSIEAGRVELRTAAYMPGELLRSIVTTVKTDAAERGATITCEADPALPTHLLGDAGRIQQILVNFVSNALKYAGGHIHLSVQSPPDAPNEIEFAVADEGQGISEAEQATLFTKFTRLKRTRDSNIPGSGLGLAACRLLADIMGGSVGVFSEPGKGARFHLRLPLTMAVATAEPVLTHLPNTTVLLVEDADYNAWAATAVLARLGLACDRARDGAEAIRMFGEKRYNVVLLDRNLPDMDGTEVARRIRELDAEGAHPLLLAVTAYCTAEDRARCIEAGMDAFVGKPLTPEKLRKALLDAGRALLAAPQFEAPRNLTAPAFDFSLLSYLSDGTDEGMAAQLDKFTATLTQTETAVIAALAQPDFPESATQAHRLVGQARMIGATALADAALDLEAAARAGDVEGGRERLRRVRAEIAALTGAVTRHRRSMSTA